jgi:EAL domain-containing protein (putative c-di-GMP-specific phosphodiesterase class I)
MRDAESAMSALGALRSLGLHLAVDDFGTGYSSMAYLERLPVEVLKVDRSFVHGVGQRADSTAIATAIVSLSRALGLRTVAEGIETTEQLDELRNVGCEMGQGWLFGAAKPADAYGADPLQTFPAWGQLGAPQVAELRSA